MSNCYAGFFYWFFGRPGWRRAIPLMLAFPFVFLTLQRVYFATIPAMFLEEPDVAPEKAGWPVECTAPGVYLTNLRAPTELWVGFNSQPNNYAVLTMPGCRLATVSLPQPKFTPGAGVDFMIDLTSVTSGGQAIVQRYDNKERKRSWWLIPGPQKESGTSLLPLEPPVGHSDRDGPPILSTDGQWVAWLEAIPDTGPPALDHVLLRPRNPSGREKEKVVDLTALGPATYVLKKLDMASEELTQWQTDRLRAVGFNGNIKYEFGRPAEARPQLTTYQEMGRFWLGWDAYREDGPYRIEWSLPSGSGSHRVPLGRSIHSAAFDAAGKWIAVSVGTSLNIGKGAGCGLCPEQRGWPRGLPQISAALQPLASGLRRRRILGIFRTRWRAAATHSRLNISPLRTVLCGPLRRETPDPLMCGQALRHTQNGVLMISAEEDALPRG